MIRKRTAVLRISFFLLVLLAIGIAVSYGVAERTAKGTSDRRSEGLAAWQQIYSVLTSPRCINCHTATNYPQQSDDRHRHFANVIRGPEDKGVPGLELFELSPNRECRQHGSARRTQLASGAIVDALAGHKRSAII
jgi:hypothetical protein